MPVSPLTASMLCPAHGRAHVLVSSFTAKHAVACTQAGAVCYMAGPSQQALAGATAADMDLLPHACLLERGARPIGLTASLSSFPISRSPPVLCTIDSSKQRVMQGHLSPAHLH